MAGELFAELREFIGFSDADRENLVALAPIVERHGGRITDTFYAVLGKNPTTSALIEGRVERLKTTHKKWMGGLVSGEYGDSWCEAQVRIGHVHVMLGISPLHVELTYSLLRDQLIEAVFLETKDRNKAVAMKRSVVKALDMSLALVNHAYAEERLNRLSGFTGFSRKLIENCINKKAKAVEAGA